MKLILICFNVQLKQIENFNSYFIFNKDGTYNVITVTKEDRKINSKGKFELINDNKLIVFYLKNFYK